MKKLTKAGSVFIEGLMFEAKWTPTWRLSASVGVVQGIRHKSLKEGIKNGAIVAGTVLVSGAVSNLVNNRKWILSDED